MPDHLEFKISPNNRMFVFALYVNRVIRQERKGGLCSGWVDDSPWPCIADESCLDPPVAMATGENGQGERGKKKTEARGGASEGEIEEKGLDEKGRAREGYRHRMQT